MTEQESAAKQAQQWFVRRGDKEHGPFTSKQLRSMAASGKITVDDLLRKGDSPKWIKAGSVNGLFAAMPQEAKPATSPPIPVTDSNAGEDQKSKSNNARKIVLGCAGAFVLLMLMCGGLIRLGNMARNKAREVVQNAEQKQAAPPYAQLSGKWRGNDGTVHDLVIHERKENSCEYTDRGVPPSNGQAAKAYFNSSNAFVYFGSGGMRVTGTYRLDGIDRIHITGQGTITRFDGPDVKQPITDMWIREGGDGRISTSSRQLRDASNDNDTINEATFADVDYSTSIDKSLYDLIPAGARRTTKSGFVRDVAPDSDHADGVYEESHYVTLSGESMRHGQMQSWFAPDKRQLALEIWWADGKQNGINREWFRSGQLHYEGSFIDGKEHGHHVTWHENGTKAADLQYVAGRLHGCSKRWWKNGNMHSVQWYVDGVSRGEHTEFYEDGSALREKHFDAEGELHGIILVWGGPGWPKPHEFHYSHGQLHGTKTIVGEDGIVHLSVEYRNGKIVQPMHRSGSLTMGRLLFLLWQQHGSASRYQNALATGRASVTVDADRPLEFVGEPSDELNFGDQTGSAIISYRCSDGELFFRRRQNSPEDTEVVYDLLTKQQVESMTGESWTPKSVWTSSIFSRAMRNEKEMARALSEASRIHTGNQ